MGGLAVERFQRVTLCRLYARHEEEWILGGGSEGGEGGRRCLVALTSPPLTRDSRGDVKGPGVCVSASIL